MGMLAIMLPWMLLQAPAPALSPPPVPVREEPMHHLKLENEYVRVFDVVVPPGQSTLYHVHKEDYVFVTLGASKVRSEPVGGAPADLTLQDGETRFTKGPLVHRAVNPGPAPFRNLTVEILKTGGAPAETSSLAAVPGHSIVLENERVRVERLVLEPGQAVPMHTHLLKSLGVVVSPAKVAYTSADGKTETSELEAGQFNWHADKRSHSLKNVGTTRFEAIEIEWK